MWIYIWAGITAVALIVEFCTSELVSIWFVGGGIVSIILAGVGAPWWVHIPVFIIVSAVLLVCFRKMVMKRFNKNSSKLNADSAIGKEVSLVKGISFEQSGEIKINGVIWTAVTTDEKTVIPQNAIVKIVDIRGNKYIVEQVKE